jgi:hypothetical protein
MHTIKVLFQTATAIGLIAAVCTPAFPAEAEPQHVWVHYDYMVFPPGWTSAGGIVFPNGLSMAPSQEAIDKVVDAFREQGLTLHIDPVHNAIPGHQVVVPDFDRGWKNPSLACVGPDAVSFLELKKQYFSPHGDPPWHYAIFGFNYGTPDTSTDGTACPPDPHSGLPIDPTSTGFSELPGFNFIIAAGYTYDIGNTFDDFYYGGLFMHELGHNFGLEHAGVGYGNEPTFKPNYISVMNYAFEAGILYGSAPGSTTPIGRRLDYSRSVLPALDENDLNEFIGVNAGTSDIVLNFNTAAACHDATGHIRLYQPAQGPIDWNCDGALEAHVSAIIVANSFGLTTLHGFDDWSYIKQQLQIQPDVIDQLPKRAVQ